MVNLVVAGLPKNIKVPKFIAYLEKTVFKDVVDARLLNTEIIDSALKTITLSMRSNDARKARRFLDGLPYKYAGKEFLLQCWPEDVEHSMQRTAKMESNSFSSAAGTFSNNWDGSQSPTTLRKELETVDLKIQLLEKQRQLVEEENKLLLEKKKCAMLKNIALTDYENLAKFEKVCGRNKPSEIDFASTSNAKNKNNTKLPSFNAPCKMIVNEMKQVLDENVKQEDRTMIMPLIQSAIRKRLIIVLQGKNFLPAKDIVHFYRVQYPKSSDKTLIEELTDTISQSCWPKSDNEGVVDNITQDTIEDLDKDNDVKIVEDQDKDNDVKIIEDQDKDNDVKIIEDQDKNNDVKIIEDLDKNNDLEIIEETETKEESEKNKGAVDVALNEKIMDVDKVDQVVDMDKDFDEWVENDPSEEKKAVEEQT